MARGAPHPLPQVAPPMINCNCYTLGGAPCGAVPLTILPQNLGPNELHLPPFLDQLSALEQTTFLQRDGPFKCVFSLSLLLQLLGLGQNRLWMVGRIVFANRLIDGFIKTDAPDGRPGQIRPTTRRCEPLPKNICETQLVFHETQDQTCCINGGRKDLKNIRWHLDEGGGGSNLNPRLRLFSVWEAEMGATTRAQPEVE